MSTLTLTLPKVCPQSYVHKVHSSMVLGCWTLLDWWPEAITRHPWGSSKSCLLKSLNLAVASSYLMNKFISLQFSHSVMSDSSLPHGLQHARPPCPSPTPGSYSNSCPLSWWRHPAISSSIVPFSSCLQSAPASGSFQMRQFFTSGGQSIEVLASTSVLPLDI